MKTFAALTYNVLAQSFVHHDRYPLCSPEALDPTRRQTLLLARIEELNPDVLCLQELESPMYDDLRARLEATHHSAYVQRSERLDGTAIFARRSLFAWIGHDVLHFEAHRPDVDDVALTVRLTLDGRPLYVAGTHLTWQPESTQPAEHLGYRQMLELVAYREAVAPSSTWIFAGDFNATPHSVVLAAALERGMQDSCLNQRPSDTCAINGRPRKLDYLLFSTGRLEPRPGVLPELSRDTPMPSLTEPSDHLPLWVEFTPIS